VLPPLANEVASACAAALHASGEAFAPGATPALPPPLAHLLRSDAALRAVLTVRAAAARADFSPEPLLALLAGQWQAAAACSAAALRACTARAFKGSKGAGGGGVGGA
jgi:hypothetical protein